MIGEGTEQLLESTWFAPPWLPLVILLIAAGLAAAFYLSERVNLRRWQRGLLMTLRWLLVGVVVWMLYGWTISRHRTDLPDLVIAIDVSSSMNLEDHYAPAKREALLRRVQAALISHDGEMAPLLTRLHLAQTALRENGGQLLTQLEERYHVRFFQVGNAARGLRDEGLSVLASLTADDESSRLGNNLREILDAQRGRPTAAIVLFTDGVTTEGPSLVEGGQLLRRKTIPLYVVGLGSDEPPRDLRLTDLLVDEAVFVNDLVHFDARVAADGFTGEAIVRLKQRGQEEALAEAKVNLKPGQGTQPVRLTWRPKEKGDFEFEVEIEPQAGEVNTDNNRLARKIVVSDAQLRVLLVQSGPSFEFRFLKTMLERELNQDAAAAKEDRGFRTVLQEADKEYVETDKSALRLFPATRDELFKYDVIIFGDVNPEYLSRAAMENLAEFVTTRGGGLVVLAGPRFTPLAFRDTPLEPLLPVRLEAASVPDAAQAVQPYRPRLTPLGISSPALQLADSPAENLRLWNEQLPALYWLLAAPDLRPGARVLAEHPSRLGGDSRPLPVICEQFVGAGRVLFHATDETYRWRFRTGDVHFARYWVQTIRALSRSKLLGGEGVELTTDRNEYRRGDVVQIRARFLDERLAPPQDDGVTVMLERSGTPRKSLKLRRDAASRGTFEGTATNLAAGEYRVWLAAPALPGQPAERRFTITAPPGELARLEMDLAAMQESAKVSGGKFYRFDDATNLLTDLPRGRQVRIEALPPEPIWNSPWLATLFVAAISAEWLLRKRWGLA